MSLAPDVACESLGYDIQLIKNGRTISRGQESSLTRLDYSRVLDEISTASVDILTPCAEACGELPIADHWNTDLLIVFGAETVVWRGPVTKVRYLNGRVIIEAKDLLAWATKRNAPQDLTQTGDLSAIAEELWNLSVANIDSPYHELLVFPTGIVETRKTSEDSNRKLWNVYTEMLTTGLDVTTFGSRVLLGLPTFSPLTLNDTMVQGDVEVIKDGDDMANRIYADASKDIIGVYPPGDREGSNGYPLLEENVSDTNLQDQASAQNAAQARYEFSAQGIRRVRAEGGLILQPSSNIDHKKLIAGQLFNFTAGETCYQATETLRLGRLDVSVGEGRETATISLQPLGSYGPEGTV